MSDFFNKETVCTTVALVPCACNLTEDRNKIVDY